MAGGMRGVFVSVFLCGESKWGSLAVKLRERSDVVKVEKDTLDIEITTGPIYSE
jgi:hypothetical protein